ncbi:MAG: YcxB family protein [Bacteroidetes bacterium]|nr:YcxB family protein [Bacteroidota bacterium]
MDKIEISTKLNINDYIKATFQLFYRKWSMILLTVIGISMLLMIPASNNFFNKFPIGQLVFGLIFTVALPILIYINARKNYRSNKRISETINYEFDNTEIRLNGESFSANLTWDKTYSVTENNYWILIWQNKQVVNIIPKKDFTVEKLNFFKEIVNKQTGLKNKLKRD